MLEMINNLTIKRLSEANQPAVNSPTPQKNQLERIPKTDTVNLSGNEDKISESKIALIGAAILALSGAVCMALRGKFPVFRTVGNNNKPQEVLNNETIEILKETFETFKLKGKFNKGRAILLNGTGFSGILTKETKDGGNVLLEFTNGILKKSIKMNGEEKVFEKLYKTNDKGEKLVEIIKYDDSNIINLAEKTTKVKEEQKRLKKLLEDNEKLSSEEFKKQAGSIHYKNNIQNQEIKNITDTKEYFELEQKELANLKEKIAESDVRNEFWLKREHSIKEKEYSEWWVKEIAEKERPLKELREKEIKILEQKIEQEKAKFVKEHKNNLPSYEDRCKEVAKYCRTEYGNTFSREVANAEKWVQKDENYLNFLWNISPRAKELSLEIALKSKNSEQLYWYNKAASVLESRNLHYDKHDLACLEDKMVRAIAKGEFYTEYGQVLGHGEAYQVNGALRLGANVDDTIRVILDEGFRTVTPLEEEITVYRAVSGGKADKSIDFINNLIHAQKGDTFVDKGYSYSSYYPNAAVSCNGIHDSGTPEIKLKIIVPKGSRVSDGSGYEQCELLFPRNAEYRIVEEAKIRPSKILDYEGKPFKINDVYEMVVEFLGSKM